MEGREGGGGQEEEEKVDSSLFYREYHGHLITHLEIVLAHLRREEERGGRREGGALLWTAGDSSLDNKYWLAERVPAVGGYHEILSPPVSRPDVTYWLNREAEEQGLSLASINTAVEATLLRQRSAGSLLPQDRFLRDKIQPKDTLVVSIGGNDIALCPSPCTILNMLLAVCCTPSFCIHRGFGTPLPCDDCCCGCGPGCGSTLCACPPWAGYFLHMFRTKLQKYILSLTAKQRPHKILVCMIYYPDEVANGSWADPALKALRYDSSPQKLQLLIRKVFHLAVSLIRIPGALVVPLPLFQALDGKEQADYVQRVEPSSLGGRKMAQLILQEATSPPQPGPGPDRDPHAAGTGTQAGTELPGPAVMPR